MAVNSASAGKLVASHLKIGEAPMRVGKERLQTVTHGHPSDNIEACTMLYNKFQRGREDER